jgi:hypothetical protein
MANERRELALFRYATLVGEKSENSLALSKLGQTEPQPPGSSRLTNI